jgi:hypothetical protein
MGLVADIIGVVIIALPVMRMTDDEAIGIGLATISPNTKEQQLKSPSVLALTKQRTWTRLGFVLVVLGFALQALGVATA